MASKIELKGKEFRRLQLIQLDLLREVDRVCRANNINYVISDGSMLGAIRHKGFIPWDDDIDVCMLREEYEKFKKVANQLNPEIAYFQDHTTDPNYFWGYGKVRRTGTRFVRVGQSHLKFKDGVGMDIFPLDDVPNSTIGRMLQDFRLFLMRKHLYAQVAIKNEKKKIPLLIYKIMAKKKPAKILKKYDKMAAKSSSSNNKEVRLYFYQAPGKQYVKTPLRHRYSMPKKWFIETMDVPFEDMIARGVKDYDNYLKYMFHDYMTPPPEDKRDPHAPCESYDFNHLYENIEWKEEVK